MSKMETRLTIEQKEQAAKKIQAMTLNKTIESTNASNALTNN